MIAPNKRSTSYGVHSFCCVTCTASLLLYCSVLLLYCIVLLVERAVCVPHLTLLPLHLLLHSG
jgi:hypothetical protein